jgi:hypothetical protein
MPKIQNEDSDVLTVEPVNPWKEAIDDTPGSTTDKLRDLASLPGLTYDKIGRIYRGDTLDLKSSDAIQVVIKLNQLRKGKAVLIDAEQFFLSLSVQNRNK